MATMKMPCAVGSGSGSIEFENATVSGSPSRIQASWDFDAETVIVLCYVTTSGSNPHMLMIDTTSQKLFLLYGSGSSMNTVTGVGWTVNTINKRTLDITSNTSMYSVKFAPLHSTDFIDTIDTYF